jgi:hypothetical protein
VAPKKTFPEVWRRRRPEGIMPSVALLLSLKQTCRSRTGSAGNNCCIKVDILSVARFDVLGLSEEHVHDYPEWIRKEAYCRLCR